MQIERSATSISWIPSASIPAPLKIPFEQGVMHYDPPPPLTLTDLEGMRRRGEFRFANILRAWIDVEDVTIRGCGYAGGLVLGLTPVTVGSLDVLLPTKANPEIRREPEVTPGAVRFVQTAGSRPGFSFLKPSARWPFLVTRPFTIWTTIELTIRADGSSTQHLAGASPFPRHWLYDHAGSLVEKAALTRAMLWESTVFGRHTPWGGEDQVPVVAPPETELERALAERVMQGGPRPAVREQAALTAGWRCLVTKRVVLTVLGALLAAVGALVAIGGGALMIALGPNGTLSSGVQELSTPTSALVSPVAAIQSTSGVQTVLGRIRLRVTATSAGPGRRIFIGIGPAAAVDRYLSGVAHDVATDVSLSPFRLTLARSSGTASPAPPGSQRFWVAEASGTNVTVSWAVTDGSYRLVAMNADGTAPARFDAQLVLTVPHLFAIGVGLLIGGVVVLLAGLLLLLVVLRGRSRAPGPGSSYGAPGQVASASGPASESGPGSPR